MTDPTAFPPVPAHDGAAVRLAPSDLRLRVDPASLGFSTTAELAQAGRLRPAAAAAAAAAATEDPGEALIEVAPQLVEVGRPLIAIAAAVVTAALTPFGIV